MLSTKRVTGCVRGIGSEQKAAQRCEFLADGQSVRSCAYAEDLEPCLLGLAIEVSQWWMGTSAFSSTDPMNRSKSEEGGEGGPDVMDWFIWSAFASLGFRLIRCTGPCQYFLGHVGVVTPVGGVLTEHNSHPMCSQINFVRPNCIYAGGFRNILCHANMR